MFLGTGIMYILLGSPYFLNKKMNLNLNALSLSINKSFIVTGFVVILMSILQLFFGHYLVWVVIFALIMLAFILNVIITFYRWENSLEVMKKLED